MDTTSERQLKQPRNSRMHKKTGTINLIYYIFYGLLASYFSIHHTENNTHCQVVLPKLLETCHNLATYGAVVRTPENSSPLVGNGSV